jgi:YVTN family beta-propeller protein
MSAGAFRPGMVISMKTLNVCLIATLALSAACSGAGPAPPPGSAPAATPASAPPPSGPRLYVSNETGGDVAVVDIASRSVTARIQVGKRPRGVRVSPDGSTVYVALSGSPIAGPGVDESTLPPADKRFDGIGVIDVREGKLLRTLPSGSDPETFAITRDGKRMFISNEDAGTVTVLDIAAGKVIGTIKVGGEPEGVDLTPDGRYVYVTSEEDGNVAVIDTDTLAVAATIPVGPRPRSTGFLPDGSRAYVSAENDGSVYIIDNVKRALLRKLPLSGTGMKPMGVDASPDGKFVFVTTGRGRTLVILDAATGKEVGSVDVGDRPWGLAVAPDGRTVFTANGPSNDVSFVDVERRAVTARVPTGDRPWGVAVVR